ncbi:MAG: fused MFS/spermidine synthase [Verrucomicrobiales bacterium]|nr:fused MFS/spermidine synthase [Verrucomicrobiales bacterium]
MNRTSKTVHGLILGSFFISGLAGLVYQVVWTRYLALFLGHTSYAVVAVLAAFMGGLALGNAWLGSWVDRISRPLFFYALLELGIGLFALIFTGYYELANGLFISVVRSLEPTGLLRLALQFSFAGMLILFPTVLMGATLPALTKFVTSSLGELRGRVASLYAINSTGAVAGVVLADWWWIPRFGLEATVFLGAAMSLGIGMLTLLISRRMGERRPTATAEPAASPTEERFTDAELRLALISIGASGFVAMVYEIAWTRLLGLALGSSTHAYSLMLATFIAGIAVGGWLIARWKRQARTLFAFGVAELALAGTLFVSIWFYDLLPAWFVRLGGLLSRGNPGSYILYELFQAALCFAVMFVPAVCLGTTLPLASRIATAALSVTGRSVGRVFAVNTLGTVLGAIVGGLWLMPQFGLAHAFAIGIAINALVGTAIVVQQHPGRRLLWLAPVAVIGISWIGAASLEPLWQRAFATGLWRHSTSIPSIGVYRDALRRMDLRYHRDGAGSTVVVQADQVAGGREQLSLKVNGKTDATSVGDMSTQVLLGHLPALLKDTCEDALVVGLGSGVTVGALLRHPGITNVDVVEISPEVATVARSLFGDANDHALSDPRVRLHLEDAKTYLRAGSRKYDVIVSEPSNPWMAGVAAVFTQEYYADARDRLKPGGLMAQWLQVYETNDRIVDIVINTFSSVFPEVGIWQVGAGDIVLIGSMSPLRPDLAGLERRFNDPLVRANLGRVGIQNFADLLMQELIPMGDAAYLPETRPKTPIHSDFHPVLEYAAEEAFFQRASATKVLALSEPRQRRPRMLLNRVRAPGVMTPADFESVGQLFTVSSIPDPVVFRSQVYRWMELGSTNVDSLRYLVSLDSQVPVSDAVNAQLGTRPEFALARSQRNVPLMLEQASALMSRHRTRRTAYYLPPTQDLEAVLRELIEADPQNRRVHQSRLAEVLWDRGEEAEFLSQATRAFSNQPPDNGPYDFDLDPSAPREVITRMLLFYDRRGDYKAATQVIKQAVQQRFAGDDAPLRLPLLEYQARRIWGTAADLKGPRL